MPQFPTNRHGTFDEVAPGVRLAFLLLAAVPACFYDTEAPLPADFGVCAVPPEPGVSAPVPTYYRDVKPIVDRTCAGYRITYSSGAVIEGVHIAAPLILAADLGRHQLVYSPTAGYQRVYSTGARPVDVPFAGWSLGFRWQLTKRWALLPEGTVGYTPARNFMTEDSRLFHVGIAGIFTP